MVCCLQRHFFLDLLVPDLRKLLTSLSSRLLTLNQILYKNIEGVWSFSTWQSDYLSPPSPSFVALSFSV